VNNDYGPEGGRWRVSVKAISILVAVAAGLAGSAPAVGQPGKAREIATTICAGCHGADGNSVVPTYPKIAGHNPDYIARMLTEFRSGKRRSDAMAPVVASLDPKDFRALGEYFGAQKPTPGVVDDPRAAEAGKRIYLEGVDARGVPACAGCHEENGSGGDKFPRLAGQHREYLLDQMAKFRKEQRNNDAARQMRAVAKGLTDEEIRAVTEYVVGLQ
jgi:cytochrome c553